MAHVLVVGGGLSGCTAALELANQGQKVTIVEKAADIGGKVRQFGCKAAENCNNCGLCLAGGLWEAIENNSSIEIITDSRLKDVTGDKGNYSVTLKCSQGYKILERISSIVVSIGFERSASDSYGSLEFVENKNVISGFQLEKYISNRNRKGIMPENPTKIAFIQCFGSRDIQEKALYCSKICCGYSTRAARVLKQYYPDSQITFFYMDLQYVEEGDYFDLLTEEGFEFVKSRPVKIKSENPAVIVYEQAETGTVVEREFDLVVLSEGVRPPADVDNLSELCTLSADDNGFLRYVSDSAKTGIYIAGCASGPKSIEGVYAESQAVARKLLSDMN